MTAKVCGEVLTLWTIRVCVAAYFVGMAVMLFSGRWRLARSLWTIGCTLCLGHIAVAMHFYHRWSHAAAYADTARQTRGAVGFDWGGGIYFNYLFAAIWLADVLWWWIRPASRAARARWISALVHAYLAFIVVNATIVFETGPVRWVSAAACGGLLLIWIATRRGRAAKPQAVG